MKIAVTLDAGPAVHQRAGLSRYTQQLASYLFANHRSELDLTLFYNAHSGHTPPPPLLSIPTATLSLGQYTWRLTALASQILRCAAYEHYLPVGHIYHATEHLLPYLRRPTVITVHDLIFERYPHHHKWTNRVFLAAGMRLFVKRAHTIIAASQQTKRDLIELYQTPTEKIHVIYQGIDPTFAPALPKDVQRIREGYSPRAVDGTPRPYLLMLGTLEPRKNHLTAMKALVRLKQSGLPHALLIAGDEGWLFEPIRQQVAALGLQNDVHFTGYVPADDLPPLYGGATCVLQPSLYEGFGFPVLEAMACGVPVICSNVSSLPEAAGDAAILINPMDEEALAAAVARVVSEQSLAEAMREQGIAHAAQFCWERCTAETVEVYREASCKHDDDKPHGKM